MYWKKIIALQQHIIQNAFRLQRRNFSISNVLRTDHYKTLGVQKNATQNEIKNAYFELSKLYHPDRIAATDENLGKFRDISAAYEILGNEQARKLYDRGLIGDSKFEEFDDSKDPIIRFYKQRQQRSEVPHFGEQKRMDAWTSKLYESSRKSSFEKNELFQRSKHQTFVNDNETAEYAYILCFFIALVVSLHTTQNFWETSWGILIRNFMEKFNLGKLD